jgi:hypothetical protein
VEAALRGPILFIGKVKARLKLVRNQYGWRYKMVCNQFGIPDSRLEWIAIS